MRFAFAARGEDLKNLIVNQYNSPRGELAPQILVGFFFQGAPKKIFFLLLKPRLKQNC
jgi:hypothetical protein